MEKLYETILQALTLLRGYRSYMENEGIDGDIFEWSINLDIANARIATLETAMFMIESQG